MKNIKLVRKTNKKSVEMYLTNVPTLTQPMKMWLDMLSVDFKLNELSNGLTEFWFDERNVRVDYVNRKTDLYNFIRVNLKSMFDNLTSKFDMELNTIVHSFNDVEPFTPQHNSITQKYKLLLELQKEQ